MGRRMVDPITAVIVDDEMYARQSLATILQGYPQIDVIAECAHGLDAVKFVNALHPQLLFLDIQMPKLDGFDVLELLGEDIPLVVFVTAHDEYAIRAFDNNALDYLLKPIDPQRLEKTLERVQQRLQSGEMYLFAEMMSERKQRDAPLQRILVRDGGDVYVIPVGDIMYFESADDYVAIHSQGKTHIKQERLQNLEQLMDERLFCRIHRSCLLNLSYLAGIENDTKDSKVAVLKNGIRLPISRSGYVRLKKWL